jgi:hypothetical protein
MAVPPKRAMPDEKHYRWGDRLVVVASGEILRIERPGTASRSLAKLPKSLRHEVRSAASGIPVTVAPPDPKE